MQQKPKKLRVIQVRVDDDLYARLAASSPKGAHVAAREIVEQVLRPQRPHENERGAA